MLFKLSNLNSNLALTLGYLKPALNNSALMKNTTNSHENEKDWTGIAGQLTWCNNNKNRVWNLDEINVRSDDVKVLKSSWNFVKTKTTTPGNNIYTLLITFIAFHLFHLSFKLCFSHTVTKNCIAWLAWLSRRFARVRSLFMLGSYVSVSKVAYFVIFL